jgi:F0F1-type ATP synthase membrane subunit b/b'
MKESVVLKSKFAIVNAVAAMLNLGDFGKVESFIQKTARTLDREIETASRSIANEKHNLKTTLGDMKEKLEDAQQNLEESYTNLDPENLKTNDAQRNYMEIYLGAIDRAESIVEGFEAAIIKAKKTSEESVELLNAEIAIRKKRISRLTKGNK